MSDLQNAWKNEKVFQKQLEYNLKEISQRWTWPAHWNSCVKLVNHFQPKTVLDIGCGSGVMSEVFRRELPDVEYTGVDYCKEAIDIAKNTWPTQNFYVKDVMEMTSEDFNYDLVFAGALFDVIPNGDDAIKHVMERCSGSILISRMRTTERNSFYETYTAYDEIETCAYYHNKDNFIEMCEDYGYNAYCIQNRYDCEFYLVKKGDT